MKKKLALLLVVGLMAAMFAVPVAAQSVGSDAQVEFEAGEIDFEDGGTTTGPPKLNFGKHKITATPIFSHTINKTSNNVVGLGSILDDGKVDGRLAVRDLRGVHNGWKLNLKLDTFKDAGMTPIYLGANMNFTAAIWTKADPSNPYTAPTGAPATVMSAGPAVQISQAGAGAGSLLWYAEDAVGDTSIEATLNIPGGLSVGIAKADLTWSLEVTP